MIKHLFVVFRLFALFRSSGFILRSGIRWWSFHEHAKVAAACCGGLIRGGPSFTLLFELLLGALTVSANYILHSLSSLIVKEVSWVVACFAAIEFRGSSWGCFFAFVSRNESVELWSFLALCVLSSLIFGRAIGLTYFHEGALLREDISALGVWIRSAHATLIRVDSLATIQVF